MKHPLRRPSHTQGRYVVHGHRMCGSLSTQQRRALFSDRREAAVDSVQPQSMDRWPVVVRQGPRCSRPSRHLHLESLGPRRLRRVWTQTVLSPYTRLAHFRKPKFGCREESHLSTLGYDDALMPASSSAWFGSLDRPRRSLPLLLQFFWSRQLRNLSKAR
jgi:hypothetical protein